MSEPAIRSSVSTTANEPAFFLSGRRRVLKTAEHTNKFEPTNDFDAVPAALSVIVYFYAQSTACTKCAHVCRCAFFRAGTAHAMRAVSRQHM